MSEKTRKTVVTLEMVRTAFAAYAAIKAQIGTNVSNHSFDRGARGKGFAEYDATDHVVRTFDSKEDALTFYSRYVDVASEVLSAVGHEVPVNAPESDAGATEQAAEGESNPEAANSQDDKPAVPAQKRRRVKADA